MTALLERAGAKAVEMPDGKRIAGRRFVALAMWEIATTGKCIMPDGREWLLDAGEWFEVVKWIYAQVDGPPKRALELAGADGGALIPKHDDYTDDERLAMLAALVNRIQAASVGRDSNGDDQPV